MKVGLVLACMVLIAPMAQAAKKCDKAMAIAAEQQASSLPSLSSLRAAYRHFSGCDDGAIAEGYSESVGRVIAKDPSAMASLRALKKTDPLFIAFVIRHIDDTVPADRLAVIANIAKQCEAGDRELCDRAYHAATD
ncbi:hypothetical protein [Luteibacter rhizovicinus]|uniref:hypothetical protein n=1 Tax=Luteibacter rhizovicinus TaxID=242606 RepID=UPI00104AF4C7|nr:hypothetical protein [Luteibacter rhizovicinus]